MDAELHRERQVLFRKSQELQVLRLREKDAVAQLSGSRTVLASLDTRLTRLDQDSLKQQKIIYNQAWETTFTLFVSIEWVYLLCYGSDSFPSIQPQTIH